MTTKEDKLFSKQLKLSVTNNKDNSTQFSYVNLNQSSKCFDNATSIIHSFSKYTNYRKSGFTVTGSNQDTHKSLNKTTKNLILKTSTNLALNTEAEEEKVVKKKRWMIDKDSTNKKNSSTLSLHIAAYENFIEASNGKSENLQKKSVAFKPIISLPKLQDLREFPRQIEDDENSTSPEVQQFSASQRLFSPNQGGSTTQMQALPVNKFSSRKSIRSITALLPFGRTRFIRLPVMLSTKFRGGLRYFSSTPISHGQYKYESSYKPGAFYPEFPDDKKPTHIIIGAGSSGCVLANRLTENPDNHVLLIEAGPKDHWWNWKIHMPAALMYNLCNDTYNWFYHTTAQKNLNDRVIYWPRGRVWGGSSSLNAMAYVRGHPLDYDRWEKEGAIGWSYKNCLPYFKKAQNHNLSTGPDDKYRGHDGPLHVSQGKCDSLLHKAFMDAGKTHPIGFTEDMNGYRQEGLGPMDMTIREGIRWSSSRAYLRPILDRKNLYTSSGIYCTKILFDKNKAIGIEFLRQMNVPGTDNVDSFSREKIYCQGNIILAGGAINTPQLLMLSGVGPASHLKAHEIPLVQDMPGVGNNLQDHLEVYIQERCSQPITLYNQSSWRFPHNMVRIGLQWFFNRTGLAASSHLESGGFARSRPDVEHPDIQFHFLPSTVHDDGRKAGTCHAYQVHVGPMRSKSSGTIRLAHKDPRRHPLLDPNYMAHEEDWIEFRKCIELSREIFREPSFDKFRDGEIGPGPECKTKEQVDEFVRQKAASAYHPSCTCKMGLSSDSNAVVDGETMKVHGLENLMIADASVMPSIVSGNLNAPTIMVAERAADIIDGKALLPPENPPIWKPDSNSPAY